MFTSKGKKGEGSSMSSFPFAAMPKRCIIDYRNPVYHNPTTVYLRRRHTGAHREAVADALGHGDDVGTRLVR